MLWRDGAIEAGTTVPFDLADRGLLLGDGVFDTALALGGRVAFEAEHVARLAAAAETLGIPVVPERIGQGMRTLAAALPRAAIRTTLTRGAGPRGLAPPAETRPTLFATAAPARPGLAFAPVRLLPTGIARNETAPSARLKTLGYLDAVLAARDAAAAGFDEALFLNTRARVACAGTGNLFALLGGRLVTPPAGEGILAGIVRGQLLARVGPALGLAPEERPLTLPELERAPAVFLTNSLRLLAPVQAIGDTALASAEHPEVHRLIAALRSLVAQVCGGAEVP